MANWSLTTGSIIDERFEVLATLGEGGFGVVFKGKQISTDQLVAIKVMHTERLDGSDEADTEIARFEREMKLIAQLKHPNVVRLIDTGRLDDGQLYTVLEYIDGESLYELIEREKGLAPREAKQIMTQVCDALCAAHAHGIVHRDLKPQNIMVTNTGGRRNAMVLDFGIAGITEDQRDINYKTLTAEGNIRGTPAYMAPEQLDSRIITPQTDVYAWGLVFLECLTGQPAVDGDSLPAIIFQHMSPDPIVIPKALHNHPLGAILEKACAKGLEQRYPSAKEALEAIEDCPTSGLQKSDLTSAESLADLATRNQLTIPEHLKSLSRDFGLGDTVDTASADLALDAPPPSNRNLFIAIGVLAVLVIAAGAFFLSEGNSEGEGASLPDSPQDTTAAAIDASEAPDTAVAAQPKPDTAEPSAPEPPTTVRVPAAIVKLGVSESDIEIFRGFQSAADFTFDLSTDTGLLEHENFERPALDVMVHEVTWADWSNHTDAIQGIDRLCSDPLNKPGKPSDPVHTIGATEAEFFCKSIGMRLPTIQEWEAIARTTASNPHGFDGELDEAREADLRKAPSDTIPEWNQTSDGVFRMTGGVAEWVTCTPVGGPEHDGEYCIGGYALRGGSWKSPRHHWLAFLTNYKENVLPRCFHAEDIGFRCVRDIE